MKKIICTLLCFCTAFAYSQHYNLYSGGANSRGLAGQSVLPDGLSAMYFNPAAMSNHHAQGIDISLAGIPGISGLLAPSIGSKIALGKSSFGVCMSRFGVDGFSLMDLGLAYARPISKDICMGIRFKYRVMSVSAYGSAGIPGVEAGFIANINRISSIGLTWSQALSVVHEASNFNPGRMAAAYQYHAGKTVDLLLEIEKEEAYPLSPKVGLIYKPIENFEWRAGFELSRKIIGTAAGINNKKLCITVGYEWHQVLKGAFSMSFQWKR